MDKCSILNSSEGLNVQILCNMCTLKKVLICYLFTKGLWRPHRAANRQIFSLIFFFTKIGVTKVRVMSFKWDTQCCCGGTCQMWVVDNSLIYNYLLFKIYRGFFILWYIDSFYLSTVWALTLKNLLYTEGSVPQTGAHTPLQTEAQISVILLQSHTHVPTWEEWKNAHAQVVILFSTTADSAPITSISFGVLGSFLTRLGELRSLRWCLNTCFYSTLRSITSISPPHDNHSHLPSLGSPQHS